MEQTQTPPITRFSLYSLDHEQLDAFIRSARSYAESIGERFMGTSWDVDADGFITVFAAGMEPLKL